MSYDRSPTKRFYQSSEGSANEQETKLQPKELMTDTASYTTMIFGLFHLLGYQFSPHLPDVGEARFWRIDQAADYGALNGLAAIRSTEI